jgi:hypothetical protein
MAKSSLEVVVAGAAELLLALGLFSLLSCSSSPQSSPSTLRTRTNAPSPMPSSQPQPRQIPQGNSAYEHPNFAEVAVNPDNFLGHDLELTGNFVLTSSGGLYRGYGIGSKRVITDMLTNESQFASKYNTLICSPPLNALAPNSCRYTTTLRGTMQNGRLRVSGGYITGPDGTQYPF